MPSLLTIFISVHLVLPSQEPGEVGTLFPSVEEKWKPSSQGLICMGLCLDYNTGPLVFCPGLSSLHQGYDFNILQMSCENVYMKYMLFLSLFTSDSVEKFKRH